MLTPKAKTACPIVTKPADKNISVRAPNLSIRRPPSNGKNMLGKE